jgi:hypothetical protein
MRLVRVVTRMRSPRVDPLPDFPDQVVHLPFYRAHFNFGVDQPGRADDLLGDLVRFVPFRTARAWPRCR